jgi:hypothetical protein
MSRSNDSVRWFSEPRTRTGVLTIRDRRDRVREQEDQEDINEAKEMRDHDEDSLRNRSMQA